MLSLSDSEATEAGRRRSIILGSAAGITAVIVVALAGPVGLVIVAGAALLPWALRNPFPLTLVLIVTWPLFGNFIRIDLPEGVPDLRYERVVILLILMGIIGSLGRQAKPPPLNPWIPALLLAQAVSAVYWSAVIDQATRFVVPFLVYWVVRRQLDSDKRVIQVFAAIAVGAVFVSWTGFFERALDLTYSPFQVETGTALGTRYLDVPGGRAGGVLGNPAVFGAVTSVGLLATELMRHRLRTGGGRFLMTVLSLSLVYATLVSFTRSAWLALAAAALAAAIIDRRFRQRALVGVWGVVLAVVALPLFPLGDIPALETASGRLDDRGNVVGRIERGNTSVNAFMEAPLLGQGPDALDTLLESTFRAQGEGFGSSHNTILTIAVDAGLLVLFPFAGLIVSWIVRAIAAIRSTAKSDGRRLVLAATVGGMTVYLVSSLFLDLRFFDYFNSLFFALGAILEHVHRRPTSTSSEAIIPV